jgi:hypothetical protein
MAMSEAGHGALEASELEEPSSEDACSEEARARLRPGMIVI